ncbi:MAG TPA: TetR/AcrR family transcriptional regulator, partial [Acidimicrobiia bacterium]
ITGTMSRAQATRHRLQTTAFELFTSKGFDNVTVEEIAAAAGVSHMTFYRNFPTKEAVVLDDPYDPLVFEAVAGQQPGIPAMEKVRRAVLEAFGRLDEPEDRTMRQKIRLAANHPGLRARVWENNLRTEGIIVDALVGGGTSRLEAAVAAGAVLGALTAALFEWALDDSGGPLGERIGFALDVLATPTVGAR